MRNSFMVLIMITFAFIISCKKKDNYITITETAEAFSNKNIDSLINGAGEKVYTIVPGTKTVFKYDYAKADRTPGLADGQVYYTYAFAIQLSSLQTSFTLIDDQIKQAGGFRRYFPGDGPTQWTLLTKGKIAGAKIDLSRWHVAMHFEFAGPALDTIKVDLQKKFTIK